MQISFREIFAAILELTCREFSETVGAKALSNLPWALIHTGRTSVLSCVSIGLLHLSSFLEETVDMEIEDLA